MSLTLTLALGLLLLAPGLGVFAGIFSARTGPLLAPPPAPGSLIALSIVVFGTLVAHGAAAALYAFNDWIAATTSKPMTIDGWHNIYVSLLTPTGAAWTGVSAFVLMATLLILSILGFLLPGWLLPMANESQRAWLYGWTAPLITQLHPIPGQVKVFTAYVVTEMLSDSYFIGYEGIVDDLSIDHDKAITRIVLIDCSAFHLRPHASGLVRTKVSRNIPIPVLYLDRSQIKNVAFNVLTIPVGPTHADSVENPNH